MNVYFLLLRFKIISALKTLKFYKMRILITGGLGQIGSHVAELLLLRGDKVCVIDNLETGRKEHLKTNDSLKIYFETISKDKVFDIVKNFNPDIIIHAAASYKSPDDWYNDTLTNCVGGANIIEASKFYKVKRFIYFQTALCYGQKPLENPITLKHPRIPSGSMLCHYKKQLMNYF